MGGNHLATVAVGHEPGALIAEIRGEVDLSNADGIRADVVAAAALSTEPLVIIDLADVEYLDSSGMRMIDDIREAIGGRELRLRVPPGAKSMRIIELTGMGGLVLP